MKSLLKALVFTLFTSLSLSSFAAGEVQLTKLLSYESHYQNYWLSGRFEVSLANLGTNKQAYIHLKQKDGSWADIPLTFNRAASVGRELWTYEIFSALPEIANAADPYVFAIKYTVNGTTYWDNNNGANYTYSKNLGTVLFGGTNVYHGNYQPTYYGGGNYTQFTGSVTVKNLAYSKQVKVLYTTNNWTTVKTATANFYPTYWTNNYTQLSNPNYYGFEEWTFALDVGAATSVDYVFQYTVNGQTYYDNNFGRNYHTVLSR